VAALVSGNTAFAMALHGKLPASTSGNLFYSPYTISLNMAEVDASGSQPGIASALHFTLPPAQLNPAFDALDLDLTSIGGKTSTGQGDQFLEASAAWGTLGAGTATVNTLEQYYGATILSGNDPGQAAQAWEATATSGPQLPIPLIGACDGFLVSLVNFDAAWASAFDPNATHDATFTRADGSTVSVPTMNQTEPLRVLTTGATPAVEIPYDGGRLAMLVVVPQDLATFEASFGPSTIDTLEASLQPASVDLTLPKLSYSASVSLLPVLETMGLTLGGGGIWQVSHVAEIKVSEAGTQASATNTTSHSPSAAAPATPFAVDRPYVFFIRDTTTGTVLFVGRIADPAVSQG
jgi:serpin B